MWRNMSKSGQQFFTDLIEKNQFDYSAPRWKIYKTLRETPGLMEEFFKVEDNHYAEEIGKLENRLMKEESFTKREELKQKINDARTGQFNYLQAKEDMARYIFGRENWQAPKPAMYPVAEGSEQWQEFEDPKYPGTKFIRNLNTGEVKKVAALPTGMEITTTGVGGETTTIRTGVTGGGTGAPLSKRVQGDVETKIVAGREQLARMEAIAAEFKPEYLELGSRLGAEWSSLKAKLGSDVSKEDKTFLVQFKAFQRKAIENINLYIKELTGAQMSEREADRLRLAQPDPGEKWYGGDDPITFKAKMDDVVKYTQAAVRRYEYYLASGLTPQQINQKIVSNTAMSLEGIVEAMGEQK